MYEHVDVKDALVKLADSKKLYIQFLKGFMKKYGKVEDEIDDLYEMKNYKEMKRLIHSIKGLSGNLGANDLREYAKIIEDLIDDEDYNLKVPYYLFKEELQSVRGEIRNIIVEIESEIVKEAKYQKME